MNEQEGMQYFYEVFNPSLNRLGPGDEASTLKALQTATSAGLPVRSASAPQRLNVLDLGCGTGAQTLILARHLDAEILAIDNHQPFLDALRRRADAQGLSACIKTRLADMRTLEFPTGHFDLIWSEGAIFPIGFREGLTKCRPWLNEGGVFALSELCWLTPDVPGECRAFLESWGAVVADDRTNLDVIRDCGYTVLDHFVLPESAWRDEFYTPLEAGLHRLRARHPNDAPRAEMFSLIQAEIDNYRRHSAHFGYIFYVLRR